MALTDLFTDIADAIRQKDGTQEQIPAVDFAERILGIPSGGSSADIDVIDITFPTAINIASNPYAVAHSLGVEPNFSLLFGAIEREEIPSTDYPVLGETNISVAGNSFSVCVRGSTKVTNKGLFGAGVLSQDITVGNNQNAFIIAQNKTYQSRLVGSYKFIVGRY